jgi:nucleoside-diphosphate-sugar epimerase
MRFLILGGTRFIGPGVARHLAKQGHSVAVFHRGQTQGELPSSVVRFRGDQKDLSSFTSTFASFAPHVVIHMIAMTEQDAVSAVSAFRGIAQRLLVLSSMDVYRAYDRFRRVDPSPPVPGPLSEDAPLREKLYPYRNQAEGKGDLLYSYEKNLVEQTVLGQTDLPVTVLRLPCVYGPGDYQHRTFAYLKRMDDGRPAILLGDLHAAWRWTRGHVDNVALAIALAASVDRAVGQVYNVGEEEALTEADWVQRSARAATWTGKVVKIPDEQLPDHLKAPFDWRHHLVGDTGKIRRELGYREAVPAESVMAPTIAWERSHRPSHIDHKQFDYAAEEAIIAGVRA